MKKALFLLMAVLLISKFQCDDEEGDGDIGDCDVEEATGVDQCEKLSAGDAYKCCLWEGKYIDEDGKNSFKGCHPVIKEQYDEIDDFIDQLEKGDDEGKYDDLSIDCNSNYIMISLLSLILLLLL